MSMNKLTKETCHSFAVTCKTREDFEKAHPRAYRLAKRAGWLARWYPCVRTLDKPYCAAVAGNCSSRSELGARDPAIYQKCRRSGWLDEFFPSKPRTLTHDFCKAVAAGFSSRTELKAGDCAVHEASRKHGWLDEFFPVRKHAGRLLTKELCRSIASTCQSRSDFLNKDASAYGKAISCGWIQEFFPDPLVREPYTKEECMEIASGCNTRAEFKRVNASAYRISCKMGWLDEFTHFKDSHTAMSEARRRYSDEDIIAEARKYCTVSEFRKGSPAACQLAYRRGLIGKFTWFERPMAKNSNTVYAYEFPGLNTVYVGRTVYPDIRDAAHRTPGDTVYEFAKAHGVEIPSPRHIKNGLNPFSEGCREEREAIRKYRDAGWALINRTAGGELDSMARMKYSKKTCRETAMKYEYRIDFLRHDARIYRFAKSHGYIDSYTWLKSKVTPHGHWTHENCAAEAAKYDSRREFRACSQGAFNVSKTNGWLDEFFPAKKR